MIWEMKQVEQVESRYSTLTKMVPDELPDEMKARMIDEAKAELIEGITHDLEERYNVTDVRHGIRVVVQEDYNPIIMTDMVRLTARWRRPPVRVVEVRLPGERYHGERWLSADSDHVLTLPIESGETVTLVPVALNVTENVWIFGVKP